MIMTKSLSNNIPHLFKDNWETPDWIFDPLNKEFEFTLDPCCVESTKKCDRFFTPKENGLIQDWSNERVFVNPPYSRGNIDKWVKKCFDSSKCGAVVIALLPVSTSSKWFHDFIYQKAEIRFIKGRVKFVGANHTAPFSSMIVIFK